MARIPESGCERLKKRGFAAPRDEAARGALPMARGRNSGFACPYTEPLIGQAKW